MATMEQVQRGLEILRKYGEGHVSAEHDIVMAGPDIPKTDVTEEDYAELRRLGWFFLEEDGCWARYT